MATSCYAGVAFCDNVLEVPKFVKDDWRSVDRFNRNDIVDLIGYLAARHFERASASIMSEALVTDSVGSCVRLQYQHQS